MVHMMTEPEALKKGLKVIEQTIADFINNCQKNGAHYAIYRGRPGATYEDALLSFELNPDTALIFSGGRSLPQDKEIEEEEVEIFLASSRG